MNKLSPLPLSNVDIVDGFWADWQRVNRERTIPHGFEQLQARGALDNLRLAAGARGDYHAEPDGTTLPFLDSDVYKWLEGAGWELGRGADARIAAQADEVIAIVAAAQRPDGYLNSYVQVVKDGVPYRDLAWGHEFYCTGHLIQAAVAWKRSLGDDRLLRIAMAACDHIDREFGPGARPGIDGHPGIEMALVELTRVTADPRYLALAERMVNLRGHGIIGPGRFGTEYWQDHEPVREAQSVAGHAVRQLYLDCGAVDVAVEVGDGELLAAVQRRWDDMTATRTYLTGGLGSRHRDEAFGDPYELPPDRAYTETCATIAGVMLAWRLLQATGDTKYADAIERAMFNGVLSGISLTGTEFFYTNPLQRRTHRAPHGTNDGDRAPWYPCACCPPNLMRMLSSWQQYLATTTPDGIQIHQYASATIRAPLAAGPVHLELKTGYPWQGQVTVHIVQSPAEPWSLSLRLPPWSRADGTAETMVHQRHWQSGDTIVLDLNLEPRLTEPDRRVDAVRGCVAIERGPLVYCVEAADVPAGMDLEDLVIDGERQPAAKPRPDVAASVVGVDIPASGGLVVGAIPYYTWANRKPGAMRVWIPR